MCLYFSDLSKATAEQLNLSVEMMRFLSWLVTHRPTVLGGSQWDFLLCSMLAWLEVRQKSYILCCFVTLRLEVRVSYRVAPRRAGKDSVSNAVEQGECFLSWGVELSNSGIWIARGLAMLLCCPLMNIFWLKYDSKFFWLYIFNNCSFLFMARICCPSLSFDFICLLPISDCQRECERSVEPMGAAVCV